MSKSGGAQFTPGPWELSSTHRDEQYIDEPLAEELRPLFRIHWDNNVSDTEAEQGATLIAAAPVMYEALRVAKAIIDKDIDLHQVDYDMIVNALAQAEGRQG